MYERGRKPDRTIPSMFDWILPQRRLRVIPAIHSRRTLSFRRVVRRRRVVWRDRTFMRRTSWDPGNVRRRIRFLLYARGKLHRIFAYLCIR